MQDFAAAIAEALRLIATFDADLAEIVGLSLQVSLAASFCAALIGLPVGALIAIGSFRGRSILILLLNALMGLPPVVVGLVIYLMLSNAGPMGGFGLLYSPAAMIIAQTVLVAPIVAALGRQTIEDLRQEYGEQLRALGVAPRPAASRPYRRRDRRRRHAGPDRPERRGQEPARTRAGRSRYADGRAADLGRPRSGSSLRAEDRLRVSAPRAAAPLRARQCRICAGHRRRRATDAGRARTTRVGACAARASGACARPRTVGRRAAAAGDRPCPGDGSGDPHPGRAHLPSRSGGNHGG